MTEASDKHDDSCQCDACKRARKAAYMREYNRRRKATDPAFVLRQRDYSREKARERRSTHADEYREYQRRWREAHREVFQEASRKYRATHPEHRERKNVARRARLLAATPEQLEREREQDRIRYRRYAASGKHGETAKAWRERNRERVRAYQTIKNANRRARLQSAGGAWTWAQFEDLCHLTGNRCYYCGCIPEKLTPDHAIPLARGGSNDITNLVPACMSCNVRKGTMTIDEYQARLLEEA